MKNKLPQKPKLKPSFYLLMMAYVLVPVFVPNFNTFDSNGPKFLALALINMASFFVFLNDPDYRKRPEARMRFFRTYVGMAYTLFLIISLLSFINAINLTEFLLSMVKMMTVFASAYALFVIFSADRSYIQHIAIALTLLLLVDCLAVFYNIMLYISREITSIMDIKSVYSHKNILTSSLFVKIPFALYLMFYSGGWRKIVAYIAGLSSVLAILMLSTRAFYIGLILLIFVLLLSTALRYLVLKKKGSFLMIARWVGLFLLAIVIYTAAQRFLFPKNTDTIWNTGIVSRLTSIKAEESSTNARLNSWQRTVKLIRDHPVSGVGSGNWKIAVLKYENERARDYLYMYKNHNDFLEITAETGLPGGLTFVAIIVLILLSYFTVLLKPDSKDTGLQFLFLPAFGILAYGVDAFFNFPADRPEIQSLFAVYIAIAAVNTTMEIKFKQEFNNYYVNLSAGILWGAALFFFAWILFLDVRSLYYQRAAYEDTKEERFALSSSFFLEGFPFVPTVTSLGLPISVQKARYLIHEQRYPEAINILKSDHSNPYDSRREYYLADAYYLSGNRDSAIIWGQKAYLLKPFHIEMVVPLSVWLYKKERHDEAIRIMTDFLSEVKSEPRAWKMVANQLFVDGQKERAVVLLDSAKKYLPGDTSILNQWQSFSYIAQIEPFKDLYNRIIGKLNAAQYAEAHKLLDEFIEKNPDFSESYVNRAVCNQVAGAYAESNQDIDLAIKYGWNKPEVFNLRGENFLKLGDKEKACRNFMEAMERGDKNGKMNYEKHCLAK